MTRQIPYDDLTDKEVIEIMHRLIWEREDKIIKLTIKNFNLKNKIKELKRKKDEKSI